MAFSRVLRPKYGIPQLEEGFRLCWNGENNCTQATGTCVSAASAGRESGGRGGKGEGGGISEISSSRYRGAVAQWNVRMREGDK